jgi:hypothetical protein
VRRPSRALVQREELGVLAEAAAREVDRVELGFDRRTRARERLGVAYAQDNPRAERLPARGAQGRRDGGGQRRERAHEPPETVSEDSLEPAEDSLLSLPLELDSVELDSVELELDSVEPELLEPDSLGLLALEPLSLELGSLLELAELSLELGSLPELEELSAVFGVSEGVFRPLLACVLAVGVLELLFFEPVWPVEELFSVRPWNALAATSVSTPVNTTLAAMIQRFARLSSRRAASRVCLVWILIPASLLTAAKRRLTRM